MKFDEIKSIFMSRNNKWMTSIEVFNCFEENGHDWTYNARGVQGHKNIIARDLSERYKDNFEINKEVSPQKYRLKDYIYNIGNNIDYDDKNEVSVDIYIDEKFDNEDDWDENELNEEYTLDRDNVIFEEHEVPSVEVTIKVKSGGKKVPRKNDYEKKAKKNKKKGDIGEEAVVIMEKRRLEYLERYDLVESVEWVSKSKGDGLGYDIVSWTIENETVEKIYIEVKTTEGNNKTPFEISKTEIEVSKELADKYYIYRVFELENEISKIKYYKINGDIEENFDLEPIMFRAYLKKNSKIN